MRLKISPDVSTSNNELALISMYYKHPSRENDNQYVGKLDKISKKLLEAFRPELLKRYSPRSCIGDGNCCYRALSLAIYGDEIHHLYIRCVTAIEMILYKSTYDINSALYILSKKYNDLNIWDTIYDQLLKDVLTPIEGWAEMAHLYAASAALQIGIGSYHLNEMIVAHETKDNNPYNREVYGRSVPIWQPVGINILWTKTSIGIMLCNHIIYLQPVCKTYRVKNDDKDILDIECDKYIYDHTYYDFQKSPPTLSDDGSYISSEEFDFLGIYPFKKNDNKTVVKSIPYNITHNLKTSQANEFNEEILKDYSDISDEDLLKIIKTDILDIYYISYISLEQSVKYIDIVPIYPYKVDLTDIKDIKSERIYDDYDYELPSPRLWNNKRIIHSTPIKDKNLVAFTANISDILNEDLVKYSDILSKGLHKKEELLNKSFEDMKVNKLIKHDSLDDNCIDSVIYTKNHCKGFTYNELLNMLLKPENILESIPQGTKNNTFFIVNNSINLKMNKDGLKSCFPDDCGAWTGKKTGGSNRYFDLENGERKGPYIMIDKVFYILRKIHNSNHRCTINPQPNLNNVVCLCQYSCTLKKDLKYRKKISYLKILQDESSLKIEPTFLVEYIGIYPGKLRHGNRKYENIIYIRTPPSVIKKIKKVVIDKPTRKIYKEFIVSKDIYNIPRNTKQIRNLKYNELHKNDTDYSSNFADQVLLILNNINDYPIIKNICIRPDKVIAIVLYTRLMLENIKFCCTGKQRSILSVDKTYNLSELFVTPTVFKHIALCKTGLKDKVHPLFFGPIFLHGNSDYRTYNIFFSELQGVFKKHQINVENIIFGSDEEFAMVSALRKNFNTSKHLLCTLHMRRNLSISLKNSQGVPMRLREYISNMIFGENGIIYSTDDIMFRKKMLKFRNICIVNKYDKFLKNMFKSFEKKLYEYVYIPLKNKFISQVYTNNNSESMNSVLKMMIKKVVPLHTLITIISDQVFYYEKELERAVIGLGDYYIDSDLSKHDRVSLLKFIKESTAEVGSNNHKSTTISKYITSSYGKITLMRPKGSKKLSQFRRSRKFKKKL
ncbi:uncharacterized protein LOC135930745 isoform X2 [Gordionus sp. m RMFG-2023]